MSMHRLTRLTSGAVGLALVVMVFLAVGVGEARAGQQGGTTLVGVVMDASGAPVPDAIVEVEVAGTRYGPITSGIDGRFGVDGVPAGSGVLSVRAPGFAESVTAFDDVSASRVVQVVLQPAQLFDSVTVTASRGTDRLEGPAPATVLTSADLLNSAAGAVDDALRYTPGFSLFRRASSRVANPTTQGVTLRGVSGSGASRTLVLADGQPLNDPFGSWVYWNRIPQTAIDRVEVVRGATGDLYGADALGGVIQVLTLSPGRGRVRGALDGGSHDTLRGSMFAGGSRQNWSGSISGEKLVTDGVFVVDERDRGLVDQEAGSDYGTGFATVGYAGNGWHANGRASYYEEDRENGTTLQVNDTTTRQFSGAAAGTVAEGTWQARIAGGTQHYFQTFSAIAADRASERLTVLQTVPSEFVSYGGQWAQTIGTTVLLVGGEGKRIEAPFSERRFTATGVPLGPFALGGKELSGSLFGRASVEAAEHVTVVFGARGDFWDSKPLDPKLPTHSANFFSPRASVAWRVDETTTVSGSVYRAYRTPTLNELHRGFRVGNVATNPNPELEPERLTGFEGGALVSRGRLSGRATLFYNQLDDAIANITLTTTPALVTRQRQNAGRVRAVGLEIEADMRVNPALRVTGLAVFTAASFRDAPGLEDIEGNRVPQVPRYQFGAGATYTDPALLTATLQFRVEGAQWEDDQNSLELGAYGIVDAYVSREFYRGLQGFLSIENLFDTVYDVGRTPVRLIGWPRTVKVGARVFLP